jgi:hypothetical protein
MIEATNIPFNRGEIMLKIGLASAALILFFLGAVAHLFADQFEQRGDLKIVVSGQTFREPVFFQQSAAAYPAGNREVIWHPDPTGASPFGFIPTQWTTRPQLLPLTWDVRTVFAVDGSTRPNLAGVTSVTALKLR